MQADQLIRCSFAKSVLKYKVILRYEVSTTLKKQKKASVYPKAIRLAIIDAAEHNIFHRAAALAYYLLFALFPLLIFVSNLLGMLDLNIHSISDTISHILPKDVVGLVEAYLEHVSNNSSETLMWFSLVFTVWFPMRAVNGLMGDVREAYHLGRPKKPVAYAVRQVIVTLAILLLILLVLLLSTLGKQVISALTRWLSAGTLKIPSTVLAIWQYLRFVLVAVIMFAAVGLLYAAAQDQRQSFKTVVPGTLLAMVAWLIVSIAFSVYVENFGDYSAIYGTLGAVIILLMWLYMTSVILIMGAQWNAALQQVRIDPNATAIATSEEEEEYNEDEKEPTVAQ